MLAIVVHGHLMVRFIESISVPEDYGLCLSVASGFGNDANGLVRLGLVNLVHRSDLGRWQIDLRVVQQKLAASDGKRFKAELGATAV